MPRFHMTVLDQFVGFAATDHKSPSIPGDNTELLTVNLQTQVSPFIHGATHDNYKTVMLLHVVRVPARDP